MTRPLQIAFWRALAMISVALAVLGAVLPVLPTVPFLIVAAWAGGKGWPWLERWLLENPRHGPAIRRWRDHGAVPRRAKWFAMITMVASGLALALSPVASWVKVVVPMMMLAVAAWLWSRPES